MSHYELNPQPHFTANEMLLLEVIGELTRRLSNFENAVRTNLPAVGQYHSFGDYDVKPILDRLIPSYPELLLTNGTFRTASQLDYFLNAGNREGGIAKLDELKAKMPQLQPLHHRNYFPINFQFSYDQLYRVFSSMAVPVSELPDPSVEGEGWNIVSIKGRVHAYYTYSAPNRVTELVWAGSPRSETDPVNEIASNQNSQVLVYLPLETIWISVPLHRVVSSEARSAAIRELFETVHGIPFVESNPSGSELYERLNVTGEDASDFIYLAHYVTEVAKAAQIEKIEPQALSDRDKWAGYETAYFLFDYDGRKWEMAISRTTIAWRHNTPWAVIESFVRELCTPTVRELVQKVIDGYRRPASGSTNQTSP